jgi:nickel/cobalt transporter (NicO) family protein
MRKLLLPFAALLVLLSISVRPAQAHSADMYFHTLTINLSDEGIQVVWDLAPGPMLAQAIWKSADLDEDNRISPEEGFNWSASILDQLTIESDRTALQFELQDTLWPEDIDKLYASQGAIQITLNAGWPSSNPLYDTQIAVHNRFEEAYSVNWFVVKGQEDLIFTQPEQQNGMLNFRLFSTQSPLDLPVEEYFETWESARPTLPGGTVAVEPPRQSNTLTLLQDILRTDQFSPLFLVTSFGVALLLGALHALSPGHGKTVVAAYLVGSRGKPYHAIALGLLVTLTHTGSVFAIGLLTLTASQYFLPTDVFVVLEIASGLLILTLGIGLLIPRLREWRAFRRHEQSRKQRKPEITQDAAVGPKRLVLNTPIEEFGPSHSHDESMMGYIPRGLPQENPLSGITWRALVPLGISGGLVPCPDAIAILLIAVTINRIAFGLSLIVTFSMGLAIVLIIIGILMLQSKRLFERLEWFGRVAYTMPMVSALFVAGLGGGLTIGALSKGEGGIQIPQRASSQQQFDLQAARILYLAPNENNVTQLFRLPVSGGKPEALTQEPSGVLEFLLSPDQATIIYVSIEGASATKIWRLDLESGERSSVLDCPLADCSGIIWQPGEETLLFSYLDDSNAATALGVPTIRWLDLTTMESGAIFQDEAIPAFNPRLSSDGRYLSFTSVYPKRIQIYALDSGESSSIEILTGSPAAWSPQENVFLFTNMVNVKESYLTRLFSYDLKQDRITRLGGEDYYNDNFPSWSPDGEWIVQVRGARVIEEAYRGDQIWLMRPDGSEAHPVTREVDILHQRPVWSPDGRYLLYAVYNINTGVGVTLPQVRILEIESGQVTDLVDGGSSPIWLP